MTRICNRVGADVELTTVAMGLCNQIGPASPRYRVWRFLLPKHVEAGKGIADLAGFR